MLLDGAAPCGVGVWVGVVGDGFVEVGIGEICSKVGWASSGISFVVHAPRISMTKMPSIKVHIRF